MDSTKHIPIAQLKLGMYIVGMDQPWYRTPFLLHKWFVSNPEDIARLIRHGIREVTIDLERGLDVGDVVEEKITPVGSETTAVELPIAEPSIGEVQPPSNNVDGLQLETVGQQTAAAKAVYREPWRPWNGCSGSSRRGRFRR